MEGSLPDTGQHMTLETLEVALDFSWKIEAEARHTHGYRFLLLSGGECTEHPEFFRALEMVEARGFVPFVLTSGHRLAEPEFREQLLRPGRMVLVQVTDDPKFYLERVPVVVEDERVSYTTALQTLLPMGRATRKRGEDFGLAARIAPSSFNFRSTTRSLGDVRAAVAMIRGAAMRGRGWGHCTPSIAHEGVVVAGESRLCHAVGNVWNTLEEVTAGVLRMGSCDRCGLERVLSPEARRAVGLSPVIIPTTTTPAEEAP